MIRINLLPVRQMKQKTRALQQLFISGLVLIATVAVLLLGSGFLSVQIGGLEQDVRDLTAQKKAMQKILDKITEAEKKKKLVDTQIGIVKDLQKKSQLTVHILDEVARTTPHERMWLASFSQSSNKLDLSGVALDNRTIANYLEALKESPYFNGVTLNSSVLYRYGGRNLKKFSLFCSVTLPEAKDEASQDKDEK